MIFSTVDGVVQALHFDGCMYGPVSIRGHSTVDDGVLVLENRSKDGRHGTFSSVNLSTKQGAHTEQRRQPVSKNARPKIPRGANDGSQNTCHNHLSAFMTYSLLIAKSVQSVHK